MNERWGRWNRAWFGWNINKDKNYTDLSYLYSVIPSSDTANSIDDPMISKSLLSEI